MDFIPEPKNGVSPYLFSNIFNSEDYLKIDNILEKIPYEEKSFIYNKDENTAEEINQIRVSKVKWINPNEQNWWLFEKIKNYILTANSDQFKYDLYSMPVNIQYTEYYGSENGHYTWHMDHGASFASFRKLSVTILYNDPSEFEGGTLDFWIGGENHESVPLSKGSMVVFPSFLLHRVSPVTKGVRKSLVIWVGGSTFK